MKIIKVRSCRMCPYKRLVRYYYCAKASKIHESPKQIFDQDIIQEWCPLEDEEEIRK